MWSNALSLPPWRTFRCLFYEGSSLVVTAWKWPHDRWIICWLPLRGVLSKLDRRMPKGLVAGKRVSVIFIRFTIWYIYQSSFQEANNIKPWNVRAWKFSVSKPFYLPLNSAPEWLISIMGQHEKSLKEHKLSLQFFFEFSNCNVNQLSLFFQDLRQSWEVSFDRVSRASQWEVSIFWCEWRCIFS